MLCWLLKAPLCETPPVTLQFGERGGSSERIGGQLANWESVERIRRTVSSYNPIWS